MIDFTNASLAEPKSKHLSSMFSYHEDSNRSSSLNSPSFTGNLSASFLNLLDVFNNFALSSSVIASAFPPRDLRFFTGVALGEGLIVVELAGASVSLPGDKGIVRDMIPPSVVLCIAAEFAEFV
jgi:hypothetical protein